MPTIAVVIPLFNKERYVERCLDSVLGQSQLPTELVIVDDASTDGGPDLVRRATSTLPWARVLHQANAGPSAARNKGAAACRSDYLVFLDADDVLNPEAMAIFVRALSERAPVDLVFGSHEVAAAGGLVLHPVLPPRILPKMGKDVPPAPVEASCALAIGRQNGSYCISSKLFQVVKGFDVQLRCWEVTDFLHRAIMNAGRISVVDKVLVTAVKVEGSQFGSTRGDVRYLSIYLQKLLERMRIDQFPDHDMMVPAVEDGLRTLVRGHEVERFLSLSKLAKPYVRDRRLRLLCAMPQAIARRIAGVIVQ